jgi:hypothetical protein
MMTWRDTAAWCSAAGRWRWLRSGNGSKLSTFLRAQCHARLRQIAGLYYNVNRQSAVRQSAPPPRQRHLGGGGS